MARFVGTASSAEVARLLPLLLGPDAPGQDTKHLGDGQLLLLRLSPDASFRGAKQLGDGQLFHIAARP